VWLWDLHVNSFYPELPEVISARLLLSSLRDVARWRNRIVTATAAAIGSPVRAGIIKPVHLARTARTCFHAAILIENLPAGLVSRPGAAGGGGESERSENREEA